VEVYGVDVAVKAVPRPAVCIFHAYLVGSGKTECQVFTFAVVLDFGALVAAP